MITKAVILARGLGTRMRREDPTASINSVQAGVAAAGIKALIPLGGRPFLDYVLSALADAGVPDICLVIGPEHAVIRDYYAAVAHSRVRISFAIQESPRGTADAVLAAEPFAAGDDVLVLNADNYYPVDAYRMLSAAGAPALPGFDRAALIEQSNIAPSRIRSFALLSVAADGYLTDIVEKPDAETFARLGVHALVSMNLWALSSAVFEACRRVPRSPRGELELPSAVQLAVREMGVPFRVLPIAAGVLDLSSRGDIAAVASALGRIEVRL